MAKEKTVFKKRAFLNSDVTMSAYVIAVVEAFRHKQDGEVVSGYPTLDIADCNNKVSLDFSFYNRADMKRSRKKLEVFRSAVNGFVDAYDKEIKRFEEAEKSLQKAKKPQKRKK